MAQWKSTLKQYAGSLRPMLLKDIKTYDILEVMRPIWHTKQETASRIRQRIERILDAAKAQGLRSGDNPAAWRGNLKELLANPKTAERVHHAAVPYDEMPDFMRDLRKRNSISALALEFTILCAARTGETVGADWAEFDLTKKIWSVDGRRMKSGRPHLVPLPDRAVEILKSLIVPGLEPGGFVFPGQKHGTSLSNMAMLECLRDLRGRGPTVHGFRSTFRDWAGDKTKFPRDLAEAALAHALKDKTEAAYRRATALDKRRKLMEAWSAFLSSEISGKQTMTSGMMRFLREYYSGDRQLELPIEAKRKAARAALRQFLSEEGCEQEDLLAATAAIPHAILNYKSTLIGVKPGKSNKAVPALTRLSDPATSDYLWFKALLHAVGLAWSDYGAESFILRFRCMSTIGATADVICSKRVFRLLTQLRHRPETRPVKSMPY